MADRKAAKTWLLIPMEGLLMSDSTCTNKMQGCHLTAMLSNTDSSWSACRGTAVIADRKAAKMWLLISMEQLLMSDTNNSKSSSWLDGVGGTT